MVQVWFRFGSGLVQVWFRFGSGLVQVWFRFGSKLTIRFGSKRFMLFTSSLNINSQAGKLSFLCLIEIELYVKRRLDKITD